MPSVSNGLYFLTLPLVSVMRVIYRKIHHARYLYIKRNIEKVWGARYTLGARYLSKNTVTTSMKQSPVSEANSSSASHETLCIVQNLQGQYCVHYSPPLLEILNLMNPVHALPSYFCEIHFEYYPYNL